MSGGDTSQALRGVLLVMAAVFVFACSDVVTKYLAMRYPVPLVLAIRYAVNFILLIALFGPRLRAQALCDEADGHGRCSGRQALLCPRSAWGSR